MTHALLLYNELLTIQKLMKIHETKQDNFETTRLPKTSQANGTSESSESSELIKKNVPSTLINFKFPQTISSTLYQAMIKR